MNQDLTPKQQTSEAIRQAETILIITGQHPTIDQAASVMALAAVLRKFGKKVTAIISDPLPQQLSFLGNDAIDRSMDGLRDFIVKVDLSKTEVDQLRWDRDNGKLNVYITPSRGGFAPSDVTYAYGDYQYDLAIIVGVPTRARIDRVYTDNASLFANLPIVNLDFHRSNEQYGAINLIEPNASGLAEILVALAESLQNGIVDERIATAMLAGLMAATDRFTASHTTAKSLTVAAQLMAAGANQQAIVKALFRDNRADNRSDNRGERNDNRREQSQAQQPVQPRQPQSQPATPAAPVAPALTPVPAEPTPTAQVEAMPIAPIAAEPSDDPIIDPVHMELAHDVSDSQIPMADFAAAAELLQQRDEEPEA